ncbi:MAG TPA: helix-turn-helix transcriptional regulator [Rhodocyclaceae bacterium]|nr:helix-turn-helix transcriptional regulator [Rhodocyclaceae bacterium]
MGTFDLLTHHEICRELGQRCRRLRLQANLTQLELAQRVGASLSSIRRLESHGQATLELLVRVTQSLHFTSQLESLLVAPVLSIADAERDAAAVRRQRAAASRRSQPRT